MLINIAIMDELLDKLSLREQMLLTTRLITYLQDNNDEVKLDAFLAKNKLKTN